MRTELIGQEYKKNGANYLKINNVKVKYELSDVHIHLDNLFNGDKALMEAKPPAKKPAQLRE